MDVCKCIVPVRHRGTLNSRQAASPLVRMVEGGERWETSDHPQSVFPLNWGGIGRNRTVTCMVLKATANDRHHLALCQDEFRGPRSGLCRSGSSPVPLKTRRVGQRCTLNLSRAETSSRWCGVVVRRGGVPAQVSSTSLDHGSKLRGPSPKSPRAAEQCDVNINSLTPLRLGGRSFTLSKHRNNVVNSCYLINRANKHSPIDPVKLL
ncbi:uncharacterized protein TNCV_1415821 [Trichonephila clavipes]|nr:uncharacterized protein TNCV_1415821 [Trichonephila clavipes]